MQAKGSQLQIYIYSAGRTLFHASQLDCIGARQSRSVPPASSQLQSALQQVLGPHGDLSRYPYRTVSTPSSTSAGNSLKFQLTNTDSRHRCWDWEWERPSRHHRLPVHVGLASCKLHMDGWREWWKFSCSSSRGKITCSTKHPSWHERFLASFVHSDNM